MILINNNIFKLDCINIPWRELQDAFEQCQLNSYDIIDIIVNGTEHRFNSSCDNGILVPDIIVCPTIEGHKVSDELKDFPAICPKRDLLTVGPKEDLPAIGPNVTEKFEASIALLFAREWTHQRMLLV